MRCLKCGKSGFTLIELLVVIAIIAVLISVLLPALSAAKVQAQKLKCESNMRALGQAAVCYAHEDAKSVIGAVNANACPPYPNGPDPFDGEGYADYGGGPGTMDFMGWNQDFDPRTRPLNQSLYGKNGIVQNTAPGDRGNYEVFQCPGEEYGWQEYPGFGSDPRETENSYYKANGTAFRQNNLTWQTGGSTFYQVGVYGRPVNRIPQTGATLLFHEARALQTIAINSVWGYLQHGELTGYHRKLSWFAAAYCDGHAGFYDFGEGSFYNHITTLPSQYQGMDCRGTWGRWDCLPEPPIDPGEGE